MFLNIFVYRQEMQYSLERYVKRKVGSVEIRHCRIRFMWGQTMPTSWESLRCSNILGKADWHLAGTRCATDSDGFPRSWDPLLGLTLLRRMTVTRNSWMEPSEIPSRSERHDHRHFRICRESTRGHSHNKFPKLSLLFHVELGCPATFERQLSSFPCSGAWKRQF